jgi:hypothetical protein
VGSAIYVLKTKKMYIKLESPVFINRLGERALEKTAIALRHNDKYRLSNWFKQDFEAFR